MYSRLSVSLMAVLGALMSAELRADTDSPQAILEEIIVTAQFRDASLMQTAGSVSVVQDITIFERGSQHLEETLNESADLLYHLFVLLRSRGLNLSNLLEVLSSRHG